MKHTGISEVQLDQLGSLLSFQGTQEVLTSISLRCEANEANAPTLVARLKD